MKTLITTCLTILTGLSAFSQIDEAIKFKITCPNGNTDEAIIRLKNDATQAFDPQWDAWKIFTWNDLVPSLYSETFDAYELTINSIPTMELDTAVNLFVRAKITSGMYSLTTEQLGTFPPDVKICLKDLVTNEVYELNQNITHDFYVTADANNDQMRFEIFYSPKAIATIDMADVIVENSGGFNWTYDLLDDGNALLENGISTVEEKEFLDLNNGSYKLIITDDHQLVDTLLFNIDVAGEEPGDTTNYAVESRIDDSNHSTASINSQTSEVNIFGSNGFLNVQLGPEDKSIDLFVYNLNGQAVFSKRAIASNTKLSLNRDLQGQIIFVSIHSKGAVTTKKIVF